jgi:hypothetical protein
MARTVRQLDLFLREASRSGRRAHVPSTYAFNLVQRMRADGATRRQTAAAIGVSLPVLARCYWPADRRGYAFAGAGRPKYQPSAADVAAIACLLAENASRRAMAAALGITIPTLRRAFFDHKYAGLNAAASSQNGALQ